MLLDAPQMPERRYQRRVPFPTPVRNLVLPHIEGWLQENARLQRGVPNSAGQLFVLLRRKRDGYWHRLVRRLGIGRTGRWRRRGTLVRVASEEGSQVCLYGLQRFVSLNGKVRGKGAKSGIGLHLGGVEVEVAHEGEIKHMECPFCRANIQARDRQACLSHRAPYLEEFVAVPVSVGCN
jgi:hypothetical protein